MPMIDVPMPIASRALIRGSTAHRIDRLKAKNRMINAKRIPRPSLDPWPPLCSALEMAGPPSCTLRSWLANDCAVEISALPVDLETSWGCWSRWTVARPIVPSLEIWPGGENGVLTCTTCGSVDTLASMALTRASIAGSCRVPVRAWTTICSLSPAWVG